MSGSHILEATTEQYGKQIEELRTEMERLKIDNQLLGNGCDHFRTRAEAAEGKVEEEMKNKAVFGPPPWSINEAQADLIKKQNATIARLREEVERLKEELIEDKPLHPCNRAMDKGCIDSPDGIHCACSGCVEIEQARTRVEELEAERRRDAIDGQGALDEANNRVTELEQKVERLKKAFDAALTQRRLALARSEAAEAKLEKVAKLLDHLHYSEFIRAWIIHDLVSAAHKIDVKEIIEQILEAK